MEKSLYGIIQASLLFLKKLTKTIKQDVFTVNPYDWCVVNKMVSGKQLTILRHVDDIKISHVNKKVVSKCIKMLNNKYGKEACGKPAPLTVKRGKKHDYIKMVLDYSSKGKVKIYKQQYLK